ncbi:mechanosensitive ion channel family protein, partial [Mesorhizobium sp. M4B.F.Ca.ET.019.03.1.1]
YTRNGVRRGDVTLTIGSWNDIDLAQKTMLAVAATERRVRREPAPIAFVATVGDSGVAISLRYWTSSADFFATQIDLTKRAKQAFDTEGISVPVPPPEASHQEPPSTRQ